MIHRNAESYRVEVKRFYLPFEVTVNCPKCGKPCTEDLRQNYLSYPTIGGIADLSVECPECVHFWNVKCRFDVTLTLVE